MIENYDYEIGFMQGYRSRAEPMQPDNEMYMKGYAAGKAEYKIEVDKYNELHQHPATRRSST